MDIKEVILAILETIKSIKNSTLLLLSCLIILTLSFVVFYQYSRQKWEKEMQRVIAERDKLQEKLNCPIQSSEDLK
jgi:cell division protein FtsL